MDSNNAPATKADVAELKAEFKHDLAEIKTEFKQDLIGLEERLKAHSENIETKLLIAFHNWARGAEVKFRAMPLLEERLSIIEERVGRLERGEV